MSTVDSRGPNPATMAKLYSWIRRFQIFIGTKGRDTGFNLPLAPRAPARSDVRSSSFDLLDRRGPTRYRHNMAERASLGHSLAGGNEVKSEGEKKGGLFVGSRNLLLSALSVNQQRRSQSARKLPLPSLRLLLRPNSEDRDRSSGYGRADPRVTPPIHSLRSSL